MVMSWVIHIGITISVTQSVGAYMMSSMYMFMVMSVVFIDQVCGAQPRSAMTSSVTVWMPCTVGLPADVFV